MHPSLEEARMFSPIVHQMLNARAPLEDIILELARTQENTARELSRRKRPGVALPGRPDPRRALRFSQ